jgi:iron complex outermembrane receptor protein
MISPGYAQETSEVAAEAEASDTGLIIVTARKQEETILDVPVAITAFSEDQIEAMGLDDIKDLTDFTPGFKYEAFSGFPGRIDNSPRFRGISVNSTDPTRQTATVFVDGVFVAGGAQGIQFSEIERIEIIKGPQSAYFGRNTFGGAINYVTKTPGNKLAGNASAQLTADGSYELEGGIEGPLVRDVLSVRIGGAFHDARGDFENAVDGGEIGREKTWSVGGTLFFKPSADFNGKLRVHYFENDDGPPAFGFNGVAEHNCGPFGGVKRLICGDVRINKPALNTRLSDPLFAALQKLIALNGKHRRTVGLDRQSLRVSGQFEYVIPGTDVTINSISAYNYEEANFLRDVDEQAANVFFTYGGRQFEDYSQELRFSGSGLGDRMHWSLGGSYFNQRYTNNGASGLVAATRWLGTGAPQETNIETLGVFGGLDFDITDSFTIAVEGRYQSDKISEDVSIIDSVPGLKDEFNNFLPRVILSYKPNDKALLYASYSKGNLPGGFNGEVIELTQSQLSKLLAIDPTVESSFGEEKLENWELGAKTSFAENRGFVSSAVYYMRRTGQTFQAWHLHSRPYRSQWSRPGLLFLECGTFPLHRSGTRGQLPLRPHVHAGRQPRLQQRQVPGVRIRDLQRSLRHDGCFGAEHRAVSEMVRLAVRDLSRESQRDSRMVRPHRCGLYRPQVRGRDQPGHCGARDPGERQGRPRDRCMAVRGLR